MTQETFLAILSQVAGQYIWHLGKETRHLRAFTATWDVYCPLTAVAACTCLVTQARQTYAEDAADALGLSPAVAVAIMEASDHNPQADSKLRHALLVAVGLATAEEVP